MRRTLVTVCLLAFWVVLATGAAQAQSGQDAASGPAGWGSPLVIYPDTWDDPLRFSIDDAGATLVALIPHSGTEDRNRNIVVSELVDGAWQVPVVIAQNGAYSEQTMQWLPQQTHPVISGDGNTIAYVGWSGATFGAYIVDRQSSRSWSAPALVPTSLANTHYWISLSQDGNTLALCDYPFFGIQQLYVLTRQGGVWSAPKLIGAGGTPSLSADGKKLVYVSNVRVTFSEWVGGQWVTPQQLTDNTPDQHMVEFPQLSADGRAITYWLVTLVQEGSVSSRTAQNLYVLRRTGSGWSAPQQVNATPLLPSSVTDGPAAADRYATRLVYTRAVTVTDPGDGHVYVDRSHLEQAEWIDGRWQESRLVAANGYGNYNKWPRLTPDGKTLVFDGGIRYVGNQAVYGALWQMTTDVAPPFPPWAFSITGLIGASGGSLFSAFDNIHYLFGTGTFSDTVDFTHSFWPDPPPPPAGMANIGGIGGIGGLGGAFAATALGPGGLPLQPGFPFTVTVDYSATDTGPTIEGTLSLFQLNLGQWTEMPSVDDPVAQVMTATIDHLSEFALFGETKMLFLPLMTR